MQKQCQISLGEKVNRLINVPYCKDKKYKRENTPVEIRHRVIERDKGECFLCGSTPKSILVHHINPIGSSEEKNLVCLCYKCHLWIHIILNKLRGYKAIRTHIGYW